MYLGPPVAIPAYGVCVTAIIVSSLFARFFKIGGEFDQFIAARII
jgi:hypothetical protein